MKGIERAKVGRVGVEVWGVFLPLPSLCACYTCSKLIDSSNLASLVNIMYNTSASW